jgi:hypothetical protein
MSQPLNDLRSAISHYVSKRIILFTIVFVICLSTAAPAATKFDFGGTLGAPGPAADYVIYHPAPSSFWYGVPSTPGPPPFFHDVLGNPTDRIAPADYNGDGLTDYGVFNPIPPSSWTIHYTSGGGTADIFGMPGDIPQSANFLENSQAEIALFRSFTGEWLIKTLPGSIPSSSPAFLPLPVFGQLGDKPVAEDYDGDGYADVAIWRPSTGDWWVYLSSNGMVDVFNWGIAGDIPVPADYNGDLKADRAVFRPSNKTWYIWESGTSPPPKLVLWGLPGDMPIPADYDGDGKADIAIYRPSDGTWGVYPNWPVMSGLSVTGDIPAAYAYIQ